MLETGVEFEIAGEKLIADASGALYWPRDEALVVADLHFEKGSSYAQRGVFLPPYDTRTSLAALERVLARLRARTVIALGDSFHDRTGSERLSREEMETLLALMRGRDWIWVLGNHDPAPPGLPGTAAAELALGGLLLRHEPQAGAPAGEIAGHLHPCATVRGTGGRTRRRCFVTDGRRLVLPAFGAYAGGLDVFHDAFAPLLARPLEAFVLGRNRAYRVSETRLVKGAA